MTRVPRSALPAALAGWLAELELGPSGPIERDGVLSWDLRLDGRRRFDVRVTIILDPATGAFVWVHLAPPIGDEFRRSFKRLLRWNDEFPFVKFGLASDDRPIATVEIPIDRLDRDELGLAIVRLLAICDLLLEETAAWIWIGGRVPDPGDRVSRQAALFARYGSRLGELGGGPEGGPPGADGAGTLPLNSETASSPVPPTREGAGIEP